MKVIYHSLTFCILVQMFTYAGKVEGSGLLGKLGLVVCHMGIAQRFCKFSDKKATRGCFSKLTGIWSCVAKFHERQ